MIDTEVSFTSLCYIFEDYDGSIWLNRLADIEKELTDGACLLELSLEFLKSLLNALSVFYWYYNHL